MIHEILFKRRTALINETKQSILMMLSKDGSPVVLDNPDYETVVLGTDDEYAIGIIKGVRRSGDGFVIMANDKESGSFENLYSNHTDNIDDLLSVLRLLERAVGKDRTDLGSSNKESENEYHTMVVQFEEPISELDHYFDEIDPSVKSLKQWIDSYESSRFTQVGSHVAVITSEYNMDYIKEWLEKHMSYVVIKED